MRSKDKIDVVVRKMYGKDWMFVRMKNGKSDLVPSFEDWYRMIQALKYCEKKKYDYLYKIGRDPVDLIKNFFIDCFNEEYEWEDIRKKYNIPKR